MFSICFTYSRIEILSISRPCVYYMIYTPNNGCIDIKKNVSFIVFKLNSKIIHPNTLSFNEVDPDLEQNLIRYRYLLEPLLRRS